MAVPMEAMVFEDQQAEIEAMESARLAKLDEIGRVLEKRADEAVMARIEIEKRWIDDWDQYNGRPLQSKANKEYSSDEPDYRRARDNITRPKVLMMAARLQDLLFPTSEDNWDLGPSPIPELCDAEAYTIGPDGNAIPAAELVKQTKEIAKRRAKRMRDQISDQLAESSFDAQGRDACIDLAMYGTAVIKGPYVQTCKRRAWKRDPSGVYQMTTKYQEKAAARRVDMWSFFPQPCRNIGEAEHALELHMMPAKKLRALTKQPGFHAEQIKRVLETDADLGMLKGSLTIRSGGRPMPLESVYDERYPVWEYHGPIPKNAMVAFLESLIGQGIDSSLNEAVMALLDEISENPLNVIYAEAWFCEGIMLKAAPSGLDDDDGLPYRVTCLEKDPDSWAGYGVAYWMRDDAISRDALWQAMMLNAFMSSGVQVGVIKGRMEREAGKKNDFSCTSPRVWVLNDETTDIKQALTFSTVPNVLGGIFPMYEQVGKNADERTLMPLILQGETTRSSTQTASGIAMLLNSANVALAMFAKQWDDDITVPLIRAFVQWNMQYSEDEEAKGDYDVIPRAASYLLVKDIKAQHVQVVTQLAMNPAFAPYFKFDELAKANVEPLDIDSEKILKTPDEIKAEQEAAQQNPQSDPETMKAQAAMQHAQASMQRAQAEAQAKQADAQRFMQDRTMDHQEFQLKLQSEREERQLRLLMQRMQLQIKQMEMVQSGQLKAEEIQLKRDLADVERSAAEFETALKARLEAEKISQSERSLSAQMKFERPFRTG